MTNAIDRPDALALSSSSASSPENRGLRTADDGFQPLRTLPSGAPGSKRRRWGRLAACATTSYRDAVELKCLECCSWERSEAKRCDITGCPLWAVGRRIFGRAQSALDAIDEEVLP